MRISGLQKNQRAFGAKRRTYGKTAFAGMNRTGFDFSS